MQARDGIRQPDRTLTKDALLRRAADCQRLFETCLSQHTGWEWALKGLWYSKHLQASLEQSPLDHARCARLARNAERRFGCSHPPTLAVLGKDVLRWLELERGRPPGGA